MRSLVLYNHEHCLQVCLAHTQSQSFSFSERTRKCVTHGVNFCMVHVEERQTDSHVHTVVRFDTAGLADRVQGPETDQEDPRDTRRLLMTLSHCARESVRMVPLSARLTSDRGGAR
jgi:hypothetical protein